MSKLSVMKLKSSHFEGWLSLYKLYAEFYNTSLSNSGTKTTWEWLIDTNHPCTGIVVLEDNLLVGLAHFREMPSPLRGTNIGFLDDLFVLPEKRGGKVVTLLIEELKKEAIEKNWGIIRWITQDNNYRARNLYDKISQKTDWNTYEMKIQN
jgi:ribosomal protein S18 acetylase RimI-like enzyme|tara:strand:+ start:4529 stop:4981 length:453 start_codon:yes stop_codon:yes gene_type:complete